MAQPPVEGLDDFLLNSLPGILGALRETDVSEVEIETETARVRLTRQVQSPVEEQGSGPEQNSESLAPLPRTVPVRAQLVGTFYRAEKLGSAPLVSDGTRVEPDTVIGIIEAIHVLTEVEAGVSGIVTEVKATDGQPVEYGQALLEVLVDA